MKLHGRPALGWLIVGKFPSSMRHYVFCQRILSRKMCDELVRFDQDTNVKFERSRHDTFSNMEEKDKTLRVMLRMGEEQIAKTNETREVLKGHQTQLGRALDNLEQCLRDDNADLLAKKSRSAVKSDGRTGNVRHQAS